MFQSVTSAVSWSWYPAKNCLFIFFSPVGPRNTSPPGYQHQAFKGCLLCEVVLVGKGPRWRCTVISTAHLLGVVDGGHSGGVLGRPLPWRSADWGGVTGLCQCWES